MVALAQFQIETHVLPLNQLLLLVGVDVQVGVPILQPRVLQSLHCCESLIGVCLQEPRNQILDFLREECGRSLGVVQLLGVGVRLELEVILALDDQVLQFVHR